MRYLLVFSSLITAVYRRSRGLPAFLVAQCRECPGEPVGPIAGTHPGPVARAPGQGGPPGLNQAGQHRGRLAFPDRDDPRDQPAVFRHVDRLAAPDPGQHLTRVVPQIPETDGVRIGRHETEVSQIVATIARAPAGQGPRSGQAHRSDYQIPWRMRTITATEASRNFSDLLDAIERGETVTITRGHHVVAEMRPARRRTGADLRTALDDIPPPDERFAADIAGAVALLTSEGTDPWAGA